MEFVIPLDKDDLLKRRGREYYVEVLTSVKNIDQAINATRVSLESKGPRFILDHFDDFFSVIVHGAKLDLPVTLRAYGRIVKTTEYLIDEMEKNFPADEDKSEYLCVTKMIAYLLSNLCCYLEDKTLSMGSTLTTVGKKKKNSNKSDERSDWETRREKILFLLYRWLQLPLQNLWNPPIVEESFVMLIADICYKILENDKDSRDKDITKTIFQILGTLVKRYIHGITCTIRILQLVKMHDALASSLANGVVVMITENSCTGFIAEIAREIDQSNLEESEARNVSIFLETIAVAKPDIIFGILENIMDYLSNENYSMRNCAIGVLGIIIQEALSEENMTKEEKKTRDECFEKLSEHMLDVNSYVRSKVFQTWQKLCCNKAVPISRYGPLMADIIPHLDEKSAIVRKQSLVLLRALLETCPFGTVIDKTKFLEKREKHADTIEKLRAKVVTDSLGGDEERFELWKELMPGIQAAIKKSAKSDDDDDDDEDENEDSDNENELDLVVEFETIRKLIVEKKFRHALQCLKKISGKLNWADDLEDMSLDEKEHYYFFVLLKIFMESENNENEDEMKAAKSVEWKEQRNQMKNSQRVVDFLDNAILFANELEKAMPVIHNLLYAEVATVAIEACTLLELAFTLKAPGANIGIQKALSQVFSREESIRNNLAIVYQKIYLSRVERKNPDGSLASISLVAVDGLIELFSGLKVGQSLALVQLISIWMENKDLTDEHIRIMWRKYTMKIPGASFSDSRCAIALLTMVAEKNSQIIKSNLDVIIHVGLETSGKEDLLLARDSCRAILAMKGKSSESSGEPSIRFENDHRMFEEISFLLIDKLEKECSDQYTSFATDAIHVIYSFANNPGKIIEVLLKKMFKTGEEKRSLSGKKFAKLLYVIGHIAIRHMVWLDTDLYKELKRRNAIVEAKKGKKNIDKNMTIQTPSNTPSSVSALKARRSIYQRSNSSFIEDNGEEALGGATADDADAEAIEATLENHIVNGSGLLAKFVPIVLEVCEHPEKFEDKKTRVWGVLALSKMMTVSSIFCKEHLQLLVTILERSTEPYIRSNILYSLSDLIFRFPNEVEPWTSHMYGRLRDEDDLVRTTAVRVLSNLVKSEMIRVKGQMSEMAICIVDSNMNIRIAAKKFFEELSQKKNILYNIMPDIISKLTSKDANIVEEDLHEILKNVLGLLQKERETDTLLDKICSRFPLSSSDRETRDIAFCLSLLQLGKKGLSRLIELLPMLKNKIHIREVQKALKEIIEVAKKKPNNKEICTQLEEEIQKLIQTIFNDDEEHEDEDRRAMPPPIRPANKNRRSKKPATDSDDEDDDENNSDDESQSNRTKKNRKRVVINTPRSTRKAAKPPTIENDDDDDDDEELPARTPKKRTAATTSKTPKSAKKGSTKTNNNDENSDAAKENVASTPRGRRPVTFSKNLKVEKSAIRVENSENSEENLALTPRTRGAAINSVAPRSTRRKSARSDDANNLEDNPAPTPNNRKSVNNAKTPRTTRRASQNERAQESSDEEEIPSSSRRILKTPSNTTVAKRSTRSTSSDSPTEENRKSHPPKRQKSGR